MEMLINSKHISTDETMDVINPYDNSVVDTIPVADKETTLCAIKAAKKAKDNIIKLSSRDVYYRLKDASDELKENRKKIAKVITQETGKPISGSC